MRVNFRKTRVMTSAQHQEVTGVVVQPSREPRAHLRGRAAHAAQLDPARAARLRALLEQIDRQG